MMHYRQRNIVRWRQAASACGLLLSLLLSGPVCGEEYFDRYAMSKAADQFDLGGQPLGYPSGVISAVMMRDQIFRNALAESKLALKFFPFRRGADMVPFLNDQRLEAGLLGDMPTLLAAATGKVYIAGLVKQTSTSIVVRGSAQVKDLAGKRIGYVEASSAHHTLLQGLSSAGLNEAQVRLVPLRIDEMPEALESGKVDAFAGWEPATSIALAKDSNNHIVFRGLSTDYFVIDKTVADRTPELAHMLIASYVRAIEWMRRSRGNLEKAAKWVRADGEAFSGKPSLLGPEQIGMITRRDILDIPSAPSIPGAKKTPPLKAEFEFLLRQGKLPATAEWSTVETAFRYDGLAKVMANPRKYQTYTFSYDD